MNRLEQAQAKLDRIHKELAEVKEAIREEHENIPFGQPNIVGRRDIYKDVKRLYSKSRKLWDEQKRQEERIEMLMMVEEFKEENELLKDVHCVGRTDYASIGVKTSVNNLDYFRNKLIELEEANEKAKAYNKTKPARLAKTFGTDITKLKRKIANLESMLEKEKNQVISPKAQALIDNGSVNQWKKKPIYYFVKGLKKVAFELDENGEFYTSSMYGAYSESDQEFVKELLASAE